MNERPKDGVDPDATVMLPAGKPAAAPDPDATVMIPPRREDDDATVMISSQAPDDDATVMIGQVPDPGSQAVEPDPEATIAIPTPGRRRDAAVPDAPPAAPVGRAAIAPELGALGGLNTLIAAANPVLAVVAQIRHTLRHPDPDALRAGLRASLDAFERDALASGYGEDTVAAASRALCALLDESASSTPWGASWAKQGLLAERHPGVNGAEYLFERLETPGADAAGAPALMEFLYVCLALGFEGRLRGSANCGEDLIAVRARLLDQIRERHVPYDGELSGKWRGVTARAARPASGLALWAAASGAALLLSVLYISFSFSLGSLSDPVARDLAQLKVSAAAIAKVAGAGSPVVAQATPRISQQLTAEIARGEVAVTDAAGVSTIVIRGDRLFASGSARLETDVQAVILRIADALDRVPGTILVTGHTDDVPIRTARFPSNWELSTERAASVVKLISGRLKAADRLRAEGLADSAPVVPNDSASNRARNRRVTIILRSAP